MTLGLIFLLLIFVLVVTLSGKNTSSTLTRFLVSSIFAVFCFFACSIFGPKISMKYVKCYKETDLGQVNYVLSIVDNNVYIEEIGTRAIKYSKNPTKGHIVLTGYIDKHYSFNAFQDSGTGFEITIDGKKYIINEFIVDELSKEFNLKIPSACY